MLRGSGDASVAHQVGAALTSFMGSCSAFCATRIAHLSAAGRATAPAESRDADGAAVSCTGTGTGAGEGRDEAAPDKAARLTQQLFAYRTERLAEYKASAAPPDLPPPAPTATSTSDTAEGGSAGLFEHLPAECEAVYDFDAHPDGEMAALSLRRGDRVVVESVSGEGWVYGRRGSESGFLPAAYLAPAAPAWSEHDAFAPVAALVAVDAYAPADATMGGGATDAMLARGPSPRWAGCEAAVDEAASTDARSMVSTASFTTVALSAVPSAVLRAGEIGTSLSRSLEHSMERERTGAATVAAPLHAHGLTSPDEINLSVDPSDSISNVGERVAGTTSAASSGTADPAGGSCHTPPRNLLSQSLPTGVTSPPGGALPWVRLKPKGQGADAHQRAGIKVVRPESVATLIRQANHKARLLWPSTPGAVATGIVDEDDCEVDDDNWVLVQPGAVLYVTTQAEQSPVGAAPSPDAAANPGWFFGLGGKN